MAENRNAAVEAEEDSCLAAAEDLFREAVAAMSALKRRLKAGELVPEKETKIAVSEVSKAIQLVLTERHKLAKHSTNNAGVAGGYAIDLEAARDEIRRRMACLRRAGADGRLPGGVE